MELTPVCGLGTLAFFVEAFKNLVALPTGVFLAGTKLRRQTEVLRLLLRTDANVDHSADHLAELSAINGRRQGASDGHGC